MSDPRKIQHTQVLLTDEEDCLYLLTVTSVRQSVIYPELYIIEGHIENTPLSPWTRFVQFIKRVGFRRATDYERQLKSLEDENSLLRAAIKLLITSDPSQK